MPLILLFAVLLRALAAPYTRLWGYSPSGTKLGAYFLRAALAVVLLVANAAAQSPAPVPLGTDVNFAVLAGTTATNTGPSVFVGEVGVSPGTALTGFPPATVIASPADAATAQADLTTAYNDAAGRTLPTLVATELGGTSLPPGLYNSASGTFGINGILTLDGGGDPNAVFIFQAATTLITGAGAAPPTAPFSQVVLIGGATACNVFWQVGTSATLGTYSVFQGNILAAASITVTTGASVNGSLLAKAAVTLDTNAVTAPCAVVPPPPIGQIQVVKNTLGGNGTFVFTSNFGLTSLTTVGGTASQTFSTAVGSNFSVSEAAVAGWIQTGASCTNGTPDAITVVANTTTVCTFANSQAGQVQIVKNTVGGNGTFAFTSSFGPASLITTGGTASQTFINVTPGSGFSVSETVPIGWTQTGASCTNGTPASFSVLPGGITVCTFTNTKAGQIQVVKNTVGGNGTFAFTSNFGLTSLTTIAGTASQTFGNLTPGGSFSVSETVPTGWTQTSATCTNGTPAAITVVPGATTVCTFTNTQGGVIKIVKNTIGGNGTFTFTSNFGLTSLTTTGGSSSSYGSSGTQNGTASQTFSNLTPGGSFSVSETVPTGWTLTSATCTNGTPAAITVVAGATTTCTFTNTQAGVIKVVKNTVGGNGTFTFTSNFGLTSLTTTGGSSSSSYGSSGTQNGTASQTFSNLTPGGSFSLSETVPTGWTQTSATCTNGTPAAITVVAGATTTCTITNTKAVGSIKVVKNTVGGNGTFTFTSNFGLTSLTTTGGSSSSYSSSGTQNGTASQTFSNLTPGGSFSLSETVPTGWTQTSATCTNGTPAAITVVAGATTTCTITNTKAIGSIKVVKNTVGGNGTFTFTSNFGLTSLTTTGGSSSSYSSSGTQNGTASQTFSNLTPGGSFSLSETVPTGWTQTSATCTNGTPAAITVVAGATTTCTITNTKAASGSIKVVKNTVGGNGTFTFTSNFGLTSLTTTGGSSSGSYGSSGTQNGTASQTFSNLTPGGSFSLSETVPTGWTQTSATCTNGTPAAITVVAGATTTCTITNTKTASPTGSIKVVKNTVNGNGTFAFLSNFGLTSLTTTSGSSSYGSSGTASQTFNSLTPGGSYSLSETVPYGWTQTSASCTNGTPAAITVVAGATTTCTITNTASVKKSSASGSTSIVNAASFEATLTAGSIASVFGTNLGSGQGFAHARPLPTTLGGSSFQIAGRDAPLFFASPTQMNLQIPWDLAGQNEASVTLTVGGSAIQQTVKLAPFAPGIFTRDGAGTGQGVVLIANTPLLAARESAGEARPVRGGEFISIYCTGLGAVSNQPESGLAAAQDGPLSVTASTPTVTIGGIVAEVSFSGLAPGAVGLYQVNVLVPAGALAGDAVPVTLSIGGVTSNTVTIAVQ